MDENSRKWRYSTLKYNRRISLHHRKLIEAFNMYRMYANIFFGVSLKIHQLHLLSTVPVLFSL